MKKKIITKIALLAALAGIFISQALYIGSDAAEGSMGPIFGDASPGDAAAVPDSGDADTKDTGAMASIDDLPPEGTLLISTAGDAFDIFDAATLTDAAMPGGVRPNPASDVPAGNIYVSINGVFSNDPVNEILDEANRVRREACEAGNVPDPRDPSHILTEEDYVPIRWSAVCEDKASVRACEVSVSSSRERTGTEADAWNASAGLDISENESIAFFYNGCTESVKGWGDSTQTPGYEELINPDNTYFGVSSFNGCSVAVYASVSGDGQGGEVDESKADLSSYKAQAIYISGDHIKSGVIMRGASEMTERQSIALTPYVAITGYTNALSGWDIPDREVMLLGGRWGSLDEQVAAVNSGVVTANRPGQALVCYRSDAGDVDLSIPVKKAAMLSGAAFIEGEEETPAEYDDVTLTMGTRGQSKHIGYLVIYFNNPTDYEGGLQYRIHSSTMGWMDWIDSGNVAWPGLETDVITGIQMRLTGELADHMSIRYSVHMSNAGDLQGWVNDGAAAGTLLEDNQIEELQVRIVSRDICDPMEAAVRVCEKNNGWNSGWISGTDAGVRASDTPVTAFSALISGGEYTGDIKYSIYVDGKGWSDELSNGEYASDAVYGATGTEMTAAEEYAAAVGAEEAAGLEEGMPITGIRISLSGEVSRHYDVLYRISPDAEDADLISDTDNRRFSKWARNGEELTGDIGSISVILRPKESEEE